MREHIFSKLPRPLVGKLLGEDLKNNVMQSNFINALIKASSPLLIVFGLLSFVVLGVYATDYYVHLNTFRLGSFGGLIMAIGLALIIEGGRFSFLLASVRDFAVGNKRNGWLGLIASMLLVVHDLTVSWKIAHLWSNSNPLDYFNCFCFLVLFGLFVEIRLVMAYNKAFPIASVATNARETGTREERVSSGRAVGASASVS